MTGVPARTRLRRRVLALACAAGLTLVPAHAAQARLGDLDPGFDGDGIATPGIGATDGAGGRLEGLTTRPDGRPVGAGWATDATGNEEPVVVQLTLAGAPDPLFGTPGPGFTRLDIAPDTRLHGVALAAAGRVLAPGVQTPSSTSGPRVIVLKLTADGEPDDSFGNGGIAAIAPLIGEAFAAAERPSGKILVAGYADSGGHDEFFLAQLNATGTLDTSGFGGGDGIAFTSFGLDARARSMAIAPDGDIVLAGWVSVPAGALSPHAPALARFNANGTPDGSFDGDGRLTLTATDPDGNPYGELHAVQVDGASRITAAGFSGRHALVVRRLAGGGPDAAFGSSGATYGTLPDSTALNGLAFDGPRALVAGATGATNDPTQFLLGSLGADGAPEAALGGAPPGWRSFPPPTGAGAAAFAAALGPAGTVYTAGGLGAPNRPFVSRHAPNAAPAAALTAPAEVLAGAPATFDAVGSTDPEGEPLRFAFDLDGDGSYEFDGGENPLALRSFPAPGDYSVGVQVTDPRGSSATATRAIKVVAAPAPVPQPVLGKQGVATPVSGVVRYRLPGTKEFVLLTELTAFPNGTEIDARKGRVLITVLHDASGQLDGARFYAGRFIFRQGNGATPLTTLKLTGGSFKNCTAKASASASASLLAVTSSVKDGTGTRSSRRVRKLWGAGRGRFRTRGRYGAATVRGTKWLTLDRCDGTKVRVVRGKVGVQDLVHPNRRQKLVTAGGKAFVPYKRGA